MGRRRLLEKNKLNAANASSTCLASAALSLNNNGPISSIPDGGGRKAKSAAPSPSVDKSVLTHPEPRRVRDREHVRFVAQQTCLVCGRQPCDAHHLRFAQNSALGRKASD